MLTAADLTLTVGTRFKAPLGVWDLKAIVACHLVFTEAYFNYFVCNSYSILYGLYIVSSKALTK
jgi:hypothetical protein